MESDIGLFFEVLGNVISECLPDLETEQMAEDVILGWACWRVE